MTAVVTNIIPVPRKIFSPLACVLEAKDSHVLTMCVGQFLKLGRASAPEQGALADTSALARRKTDGSKPASWRV